jgi:DNA (cytosine-5)-methyltransferase 1
MENVEGLMLGNAWKYVQDIYKKFHDIGYKVKHWLLKGETMGVPQTRHRVFFVATKLDFDLDKVDMYFNYEQVLFKEIKDGVGDKVSDTVYYLISNANEKDKSIADVNLRLNGKGSRFNEMIVWDNSMCPTIHAHGFYRGNDIQKFSMNDYRNAQTFSQDYDYGKENVAYICGMSVPPLMIKRLVTRLIQGGLFNYKGV